jgi:hypothetical protein
MLLRTLLVWTWLATLSGCSLLLDRRADQCASDGDCARFAGTTCDTTARVCISVSRGDKPDTGVPFEASSPVSDASDAAAEAAAEAGAPPCRGPKGCFQCAPTNDLEYANRCTEAQCKPFDNRARLTRLLPDGALLPLPEAGASPLPE